MLSFGMVKSKFIEGVHPTGPKLVHLFTPGTRVVRGPDWRYMYGDQDGGASKPGTISAEKVKGCNNWIRVKWDSGCCDNYRMGAENYYDLQLAGGETLKDFIQSDITNSTKWPVSEKLSKALFTSPLPSHLECEICLDVLTDPLQTSCCGQSYCKDCISKLRKQVCPHCRENLEVFPDKKSVRFINELEIKCPYHIGDKCQWKGSLSELKNHLKICDIKPVLCCLGCGKQFEKKNEVIHSKYFCSLRKIPCKYCQKQVMDKDMAKHHEECPKMPLLCPNKCSSEEEITREDIKKHIEVCPEQVVPCKYSEFGCDVHKVKRKDYDQHLSSSMEQHLYIVSEYAKNTREMLEKKIESRFAALEKRLH